MKGWSRYSSKGHFFVTQRIRRPYRNCCNFCMPSAVHATKHSSRKRLYESANRGIVMSEFRSASTLEGSVPQGLKPKNFSTSDGTAEAVPFPKPFPKETLPESA